MVYKYFLSIIAVVVTLWGTSCSNNKISSIDREKLMDFSIGRLEDQLDLFNIEGRRSTSKTNLKMRDGLFYISNGNGQKIVRYNSFGDLLFMIYNDETQPPPLKLHNKTENISVTRWASPWPLTDPGCIAVNSTKHIFVEDKLPPERHGYDRAQKALLDSLVLHFDADGSFVEYLGQEGPGGTPFPRIEGIYTSINDEIAVVCHTSKAWKIFWFSSRGELLYSLEFKSDTLPMPHDQFGLIPSLDSIGISPDSRKIFLKIDYYREILEESTNTISGREADSSYIWSVSSEDGSYLSNTLIPFYEYITTVNNKKVSENLFYSMFGAINRDRVFLYFPVEDGFSILLLSVDNSGDQKRGIITIEQDELQFCSFDVTSDGILTALLATNNNVRLVWWRTDKLAREL
ncbi:MAG: lipoprotein [Termitinemataceae bacterium]|nr:MAG: lipoprotein [Termitinemataceae bacterium]